MDNPFQASHVEPRNGWVICCCMMLENFSLQLSLAKGDLTCALVRHQSKSGEVDVSTPLTSSHPPTSQTNLKVKKYRALHYQNNPNCAVVISEDIQNILPLSSLQVSMTVAEHHRQPQGGGSFLCGLPPWGVQACPRRPCAGIKWCYKWPHSSYHGSSHSEAAFFQ